jgi:hypothetical protein
MTRSNWLKAAALVGCLFVAVPGCKKDEAKAPGTPPPGATTPTDTYSPKATAKSLTTAFKNGDSVAAKSLVTGNDDQMKAFDGMTSVAAAMKKMHDAADAKFGKDNALTKDNKTGVPDPAEVDTAEIKETGDTATVKVKSEDKPLKLVKKDGKWLADLASMELPPSTEVAKMADPMIKAANELASEISAGKYADANAAKAAMGQKMAAAMMGSAAPSTLPAIPH